MRLRRILIVAPVAIGSVLLIVLIALMFASSVAERTILVEARTTGATVTFQSEHTWDLGSIQVCEALPMREVRPGVPQGDRVCAPGRFLQAREFDELIDWEPDGVALIEVRPSGALEIVASGVRGLPDRSRLLVGAEAWREAGAQAFVGSIAIGDAAGQLLDGRYEVRQSPTLPLLPEGRQDVVKSGALLRGGNVAIVQRSKRSETYAPAQVFGNLMAGDPDQLGLHVMAVSKPSDTALEVVHLGAAERLLIRPNVIDFFLASPMLIALTLILTLFVGVAQLFFDTVGYLREHPRS